MMPAGEYWIGDPCYFIKGVETDGLTHWNHLLNKNGCFNEPMTEYLGHTLIGFSTAYGDGKYYDQLGRAYPVDAGLIGAVPAQLVTHTPWSEAGHKIVFDRPFECHSNDGLLTFGDIVIDTRMDDDWDEDDE